VCYNCYCVYTFIKDYYLFGEGKKIVDAMDNIPINEKNFVSNIPYFTEINNLNFLNSPLN
jgi:hypothetical protein